MRIGHSRSVTSPEGIVSFDGDIMNVSVWRCALSRKQQISAAFGRLMNKFDHLCGFWSLDGTLESSGPRARRWRLLIEGDPTAFEMSEASNMFLHQDQTTTSSVQIYGAGLAQTTIYNFAMPAAVPYFGLGIMADDDTPTCPAGNTRYFDGSQRRRYGSRGRGRD